MGAQIPAPSGLNIPFLKLHCSRVEDKLTIKLAEFGCPIGLDKSVKLMSKKVQNHKGAREFPKQIDSYLEKECRLGACIGQFQQNPFKQACHISPINSVEKRDSTERRVIVDQSYPKRGLSVNAAINLDLVSDMDVSLKYPTVDALVDLVVRKDRGCALMKRDLSRAYRQIPVDMGDIHTLGYQWKWGLYFDLALPMGLKSAAFFCQKMTNLIRHILEDEGFEFVNYLDDFGGAETMTFLGILFDSVQFTLSTDEERLSEIRDLLDCWLARQWCSRNELQSLLGKLNFVAACVRPGQVSTMRLLALLRDTPATGSIAIPEGTKADLLWWEHFLVKYNGVSVMPESPWTESDELLSTDTCLDGCGGWFRGRFFHAPFPEALKAK